MKVSNEIEHYSHNWPHHKSRYVGGTNSSEVSSKIVSIAEDNGSSDSWSGSSESQPKEGSSQNELPKLGTNTKDYQSGYTQQNSKPKQHWSPSSIGKRCEDYA
jgi:hypothetical protein